MGWRSWEEEEMTRKVRWDNLEDWKGYGLEQGYNKRNPISFRKSTNRNEKSWYRKGGREEWLGNFNFKRKRKRPQSIKKKTVDLFFKSFEEWEIYGIKKGYEKKIPSSLKNSENEKERYWYNKGLSKVWTKKFNFEDRKRGKFKNFREWKAYGIKNDYNNKNSNSIICSDNEGERYWYWKGANERWLTRFSFNPIKEALPDSWQNFESWKAYGLEKKYDKRNSVSLVRSNNKNEKSWYSKGAIKRWLKDFPFIRIKDLKINSESKLKKFLKENPEAKEVASLASANGYIRDVADILVQLYPKRFPSASQLARSLPGAVKRIGYSLLPFKLGNAKGFKNKIKSLPRDTRYSLEEILFSIVCDQYQVQFNQDPSGTLEEIRNFTREKNGMKTLASKVLKHYEKIHSFEIPGFGRMRDRIYLK